mmetsp:Transcript_16927/g.33877  ORF Transcript_16927/g.33877 Transcript_16927/m.33877 type:complete len:240 (-) Transcript_16927:376-1095(-)
MASYALELMLPSYLISVALARLRGRALALYTLLSVLPLAMLFYSLFVIDRYAASGEDGYHKIMIYPNVALVLIWGGFDSYAVAIMVRPVMFISLLGRIMQGSSKTVAEALVYEVIGTVSEFLSWTSCSHTVNNTTKDAQKLSTSSSLSRTCDCVGLTSLVSFKQSVLKSLLYRFTERSSPRYKFISSLAPANHSRWTWGHSADFFGLACAHELRHSIHRRNYRFRRTHCLLQLSMTKAI